MTKPQRFVFDSLQPRVTAVNSADLLLGFSGVLPIKPSVPALTLPGSRCCLISRLLALHFYNIVVLTCLLLLLLDLQRTILFLGFSAVLPIKPLSASPSHSLVALILFCCLSGRWTLYMNFAILFFFLIVASYNDAFTAEKLETATGYGTKIVVATSNGTISLGSQRPSQGACDLEESSLQRSSFLVSHSTSDRRDVGATMEMCTMQTDGKGQRFLLSKLRPALDCLCRWPCSSSPVQLGLGSSVTTHRDSTTEDKEQICRTSTRWWSKEGQRCRQATSWQQPGRQSIWERQRRSQRCRKVVGWINWIGCSIALCNLSGLTIADPVGAGRSTSQCGDDTRISKLLQRQQRASSCCCQSIPGQEPDARGPTRLGRESQSAILHVHHKGLAFCYEQSWQIQETSSGSCGGTESPQTGLDSPPHGIPRTLAKAVTRFYTTTGDAGRKRKQSDSRYTTGQQEHPESQLAGRRHGRTNACINIGTSSPGQSRSLHAEGQRDDRFAKEAPKMLWRMYGCYRPQGSQGRRRGDCGFRRRRREETEETEVAGPQRWCFVINGRALLCQKSNRKHAGRVQFDPLVEAYDDNGIHRAAGFGFELAITFNVEDFHLPLMSSPMLVSASDHIASFAFGLRANLTANCLRHQVLDDTYGDALHRQCRVPERHEIPRHEPPVNPFAPVAQPPIVVGPRVIIDEWGFLRDLLTQAEEVPTDAFLLEMYGLLITHHSVRVQESGPSMEDIRRTVQAAWEDVMPAGSVALVHCLKPQDSVRLSPLQVIVEILPFGVDIPQNEMPILYKVRRHSEGSLESRSAYMQDMQTGYETLIDAGAGDDCHPLHGYTCNVHIEGRAAPLPQRHAVRPGSVVAIFIHDDVFHGAEVEDTEHVSLMQDVLQLCKLPQAHDNDSHHLLPRHLVGKDLLAYQRMPYVGFCHDDGLCISTQFRTTDELQEAIDMRSASLEEATVEPIAMGAPVDPLLIIEDPDEAIIVMYGLYQAHVGERRSASQWDIHAVRECVFRTWDDFLLPGITAFLHLVRPQEYLRQFEIHVIVEFSCPMTPLPNFDMPSLRRTIWHSVGADHPIVVAAYHTPGTNRFELLRGTGLFEWCGPDSRATCNVFIEKSLLLPLALARVQPGSLVEVFVHDILDSDAISTLQVSLVDTRGGIKSNSLDSSSSTRCDVMQGVENDEGNLGFGGEGMEDNSASGTPGLLSSNVPFVTWRPNPNLVEDFDAVVPFRHRTTDGHIAFGRTIPPPNWERNPFLRSAAASGAAYRDDDGELRVLIRSWIASTHSTLILPHRDVTIRGQLMHELENRIRRAWPDQIATTDQVRLTTVRPTPNVGFQGQRPLHVLIELNRPRHSQLHPILIAHREIDHNGPSPLIEWIPVLVATPVGVTTLHRICSPPCGAEQMLIPQPGRIRRWLQRDQGRPVFSGLFLPIWWDLRLQQQQGPAYAHDERPEGGEDTALLQRQLSSAFDERSIQEEDEAVDSIQLMQRSGSRTPRRDLITPSSVSSSLSPVLAHVFHLSAEHRLITFDRAAPLSFFQQLDSLWKRPAHSHSIALHEVKTPPPDLETSADVTFVFEQAPDRSRQAAATDQLILLDIEIYSHGETTPGKHIRRVIWSRRLINRQAMLSLTAAVSLCEVPGTTCELSMNRHIWPEEDTANRHVLHGDFIRLRIDAASPSEGLHMALCEQEFADAQRYVFGRSPSRSPTPSDSVQPEEEEGHSEEAASLSLLQRSAAVAFAKSPKDSDRLRVNVRLKGANKPHVDDLWCASTSPSAPLGLPDALSSLPQPKDCDAQPLDNAFSARVKITLDQCIPPPIWLRIPITDLMYLAEQLATVQMGFAHGIDQVVNWHDTTKSQFECTPLWSDELPVKYHFFTDGSSIRDSESQGQRRGASAIVLIVQTDQGLRWGGSRTFQVDEGPTAPKTEIVAIVMALLWCVQVGDVHPHSLTPFQVSFGYDCQAAGHVAAGQWRIKAHQALQTHGRALALWVQHRFNVQIDWEHIRSHTGHPWNEAADALSWAAVHNWILAPPAADILQQLDIPHPSLSSWLWMIDASHQQAPGLPTISDRHFLVNVAPPLAQRASTGNQPFLRRQMQESPQQARTTVSVKLNFATANVLTLYDSNHHAHGYISARQEALMEQMFLEDLHFIGTQETRSRCEGYLSTEKYHVLAASATKKGNGGVELWVSKTFEFPHRRMHISVGDLKILHATSKRLVARINSAWIRLIVVVCHAPASSTFEEAELYWQNTSLSIPTKYQTWPTVYLCDANARLGEVQTTSVGGHGAEAESPAGTAFHHWLQQHDLLAPQTFMPKERKLDWITWWLTRRWYKRASAPSYLIALIWLRSKMTISVFVRLFLGAYGIKLTCIVGLCSRWVVLQQACHLIQRHPSYHGSAMFTSTQHSYSSGSTLDNHRNKHLANGKPTWPKLRGTWYVTRSTTGNVYVSYALLTRWAFKAPSSRPGRNVDWTIQNQCMLAHGLPCLISKLHNIWRLSMI